MRNSPLSGPLGPRRPALQASDLAFVDAVSAAQLVPSMPAVRWALYLMLLTIVVGVTWASVAQVDMISRAEARVVPDGREQVIASLEGGLLRELLVREGQTVEVDQPLALLDPTRLEAQRNEGQARRTALRAAITRLTAEANGRPLQWPADLRGLPRVIAGESDSYQARQRALNEAVAMGRRNQDLLERELEMAESMSAKGLMSMVEVMRVRRQVNDLQLQTQERINRFRQDANAELVRLQSELTQFDEQMVLRRDALERTVLKSPVRGVVKRIVANTLGGVVAGGATVMEVVPQGERILVEARLRPADVGFVKVGQTARIKLSAYESTVYGTLDGRILTISPDVLGLAEQGPAEASWYRVLVQADRAGLQAGGKPLSVLPGMTGQAEIYTGRRSVLSYLLRPVLKAQEAFRER